MLHTSIGFRKVRLHCIGPAFAVSLVWVGEITMLVRFTLPFTRPASPMNE